MRLVERAYRDLGITRYSYRLSPARSRKQGEVRRQRRDVGARRARPARSPRLLGLPYRESRGDAAFYGPKLDIQLADVMGHEETYSTIQVDFHLPSQFGLVYTAADGKQHRPVMIHRAIISTMERMVSYLIEHYAGNFPALARAGAGRPRPHRRTSQRLWQKRPGSSSRAAGLRVELDSRNEKMNAKIRDLTMQKIPYILVFGDKEQEAGAVSVRVRGKGDQGSMPLADFIAKAKGLVESKAMELI